MNDLSAITEVVSTVGFPIVCFLLCGWYVKYREDKNDEKVEKLNAQHDTESKQMIEALNNNTIALHKLAERLEGTK